MPKKKKIKNFLSDTDSHSGGPSDSDAQKGRTRKVAGASKLTIQKHVEKAKPLQSDEQIMAFVSEQELAKYSRPLGIKRLMLADLSHQSDLTDRYVGGQVISTYSMPYSQGHDLCVFIQDDSTTHDSQYRHLRVTIGDDLAEKMPTIRDDVKIFFYKAEVADDTCDFSQDHGKCLVVQGDEVHVWIVHKDARQPRFFSRTSCGKKWWKKIKQRRELQEELRSAESSNKAHKEGRETTDESTDVPPHKLTAAEGISNSQEDSSFPDNSDFPDSALLVEDSIVNGVSPASSSSPEHETSSSSCESDREWTVKHRRAATTTGSTGRRYKYKKLAELKTGDTKMNTIGVVKEFKPPALSGGSDYYSTMTLVDESDPRVGVKCVIFGSTPDKLPGIKREGDIVCLHRVSIKSYQCQPQIQGPRYCSSIRFSGEMHKKITPHTGSVSFTCTLLDRERVKELRQWARNQRKEMLTCLESIIPDSHFDLVCQVVSVTISKVPRCAVLTVWDATLQDLQCRKINLEKQYEEGYPIVKEDPDLSEFSAGCEANVVVYDKSIMNKASVFRPRQLLFLKNLSSSVVDASGAIEVSIPKQKVGVPSARIEVLSAGEDLCSDLERRIEEVTTPVTVTRHRRQPVSTIEEITSYNEDFPAKFHCRAKVMAIHAPSLEDLVLLHCKQCGHLESLSRDKETDADGVCREACRVCSESGQPPSHPSCQFYFKITLRDKSGEVIVEVAHEQALKLFNNLKPCNFYQNQELRYQLLRKVYTLTGGNNPFGGNGGSQRKPHPRVDCCVLAVDHDESIYHCLFDTKLK